MEKKPLIFIDGNDLTEFCDNRCANTKCKKHISRLAWHSGSAKIGKMRDAPECEGYISKWKKTHEEIQAIQKEMREAGIE